MTCLNNVWVPDGCKDVPGDRLAPRRRLKESLDEIFAEKFDKKYLADSVESKVFGIGVESYTVGSHEFYMNYAAQNHLLCLLDTGHFHPTEVVSDKISSMLLFNERLALTGVILSKLDGDARGGAALAVKAATGIPIKLAGVGEKIEDIEEFDAGRMAQRIMGMGDLAGLMEKVQAVTDTASAERLAENLKKNRFTMEDLLEQLRQVQKMGPLEKVLEMLPIPGGAKALQGADMDPGRIKRVEAVILSMTARERKNPEIIKGSRRRRIALGSGTSVQEVNQVLKQYEQMRQIWKTLGSKGRRGGMAALKNLFR